MTHKKLSAIGLTLVIFLTASVFRIPSGDTGSSTSTNGDMFLDAWLSLRRDIDALTHSGIHPGLLANLVEGLPGFLAADVTRITTDPFIFAQAAKRWHQEQPGPALTFLKNSFKKNEDDLTDALLIELGDKSRIDTALKEIKSASYLKTVRPATTLALAGHPAGLKHLRKVALSGKRGFVPAARQLGRFGTAKDHQLLEQLVLKYPTEIALFASLGEFVTMQRFPVLHRLIEIQDPTERRRFVNDGLYDSWFTALHVSIDQGVGSLKELRQSLKSQRRPPTGYIVDKEIWQRHLAVLAELVDSYRPTAEKGATQPEWPTSLNQARESLKQYGGIKWTPRTLATRTAAAIYICKELGSALRHQQLLDGSALVRILTPGGGRASDNSLATSWQTIEGGSLSLEVEGNTDLLWIANDCPYARGSRIKKLRVETTPASKLILENITLERTTRYYRPVKIGRKSGKRIKVTILETSGGGPTCITEIRASKAN